MAGTKDDNNKGRFSTTILQMVSRSTATHNNHNNDNSNNNSNDDEDDITDC